MVEKQIEFYFSKHPHIELDCGWSRKGSSNSERSLIMANNIRRNADTPYVASPRVVCNYQFDLYTVALRLERALEQNEVVLVHFEYLDHSDPTYIEEDFAPHVIEFTEFEAVVNYLISEFNCVHMHDEKPLRARTCLHTADIVFTGRRDRI